MNAPEWTRSTRPIDDIDLDVAFLISDTFYYGPSNDFTTEEWEQLREPLYQPDLKRYDGRVLSADAVGSPIQLIRYYHDVLDAADRHSQEVEPRSPYFWIRPRILSMSESLISFPWYDTWMESISFLQALQQPGNGLLFDDLDQCWEVEVYAEANRLFLRETDFDSGELVESIACNRKQLVEQIPDIVKRVEGLLQTLISALGRDYWSGR